MNNFSSHPTYYCAFDPGSGRSGLKIIPANGIEPEHNVMVIDSQVSTGNSDDLLGRGDIDAKLHNVLRDGEALISLGGIDYYLQDLVKEGKNPTYQLANPERYWSNFTRVLLLTLASQLISDRCFTLRVVTALPVTLYNKENRARMKKELSKHYRYSFNGREREVTVDVGYVAMEGQGILIDAGLTHGEQAVIDIGERTSDFVGADGQKLTISMCRGNEDLGTGLITDALIKLFKRYERVISIPKAHELMEQWSIGWSVKQQQISFDTPRGVIAWDDISRTIEKARTALSENIIAFAGSVWNKEGEAVGQRFDRVCVGGGGAHYCGDLIGRRLPHVVIPRDPEDSNLNGYADLALSLEDKLPGAWVA